MNLEPGQISDFDAPKQIRKSSLNINPLNPEEKKPISRWNWGAFFFHWIWGIFNGCPIAFLWFIPVIGPLVMPFILGAKGNEWAWQNKTWRDEFHFQEVQKKWSQAALIIFSLNLLFFVLAGGIKMVPMMFAKDFKLTFLGSNSYKHSEKPIYDEVLVHVKKNTEITQELGEPLKLGEIFRARLLPRDSQKAEAYSEFEVIGAHKSVRIYAEAQVDTGVVFLKQLVIYFENPNRKVWLIPYYRDPPSAV